MQAIILAAGMGKRLKKLTADNTKCMVKVNGLPLIDRMLEQIEARNVSRIVMVVGYERQKLMDHVRAMQLATPVIFIENPIYDKTNNIYSLALAKTFLCQEDSLLFESDLIFEDAVIDLLLNDSRETLALVAKYESWMDGTCVKLDENDNISAFVPGKLFRFRDKDEYYKTVNIYKFSADFSRKYYVPFLDAYTSALGENEYYEQVLRVITMLDQPAIKAKRLSGQKWYEIDDVQDLDIAESIFAPDSKQQLSQLMQRYGGYWRYPQLLDFCYLVNPYFPPKRMIDELKASFEVLLTQYPSGMRVNALLAAKNFSVEPEQILVGNGAAELIKSLMERLNGKNGIIRPTFEEYGHRCEIESQIVYHPANEDFSYGADDLISFFGAEKISNLILINPDNPSGNYIPKADLLRLISWAKTESIQLVIDESFADFADEQDNTLLDSAFLEQNPHLIVVKSISKSYGVPGLRLGVLASGNQTMIAEMKKDVAIWNINSFGEFFLQIAEKYKKDYSSAMERFRAERARYVSELRKIQWLRIIPSQANYVMAEVCGGVTSQELAQKLLQNDQILIKDLAPKLPQTQRQFVRLAVRSREENERLLQALRNLFS